ncbi:YcaO-like family protein [Collimonas humicola]|uniref:YcaO-like family protein n=1 Tax=Collimonas humicola TaxID=2825886 RepID=UPI001B8C1B80|nr:YcaO-like family protein [Collimonas humicola]
MRWFFRLIFIFFVKVILPVKTIAPERSLSLQDAEVAIDKHFFNEAIGLTVDRYGSPLSSTVATLHFPCGSMEDCVGCGKGYELEARVGAKYEAYEHYMGPICLHASSSLQLFDAVASQPALSGILPMRLLGRSQPSQISALTFDADAVSGDVGLLYPSFLINHQYADNCLPGDDADYSAARRYSCGTGIAAGFGFTEAAIHAASEVVERHSVGRFIAQHFFYDVEEPMRSIIPDSMPAPLLQILRDAEDAIGASIQVYNVTSQIDYPVFIAYCQDKRISDVHVIGGGCSLYPSHAAARAIKELVQQYKVAEGVDHVSHEWSRSIENLTKYQRLLRCLRLQFDARQRAKISLCLMPKDPEEMFLDQHLSHLKRECLKADFPIWLKELHSSDSQVSLACAVMPKMERFSIVSLGGRVVPSYQYS